MNRIANLNRVALAVLMLLLFACSKSEKEKNIPILKLTLDRTELTLPLGSSARLVATIEPNDATRKELSWSSKDKNIVQVDDKGVLTPVAKGQTVITVKALEGDKSAECRVTVEDTAIESLTFAEYSADPIDVKSGDRFTLTPKILPEGASNPSVVWTVSPEGSATVEEGVVSFAEKSGEVEITATSVSDASKKISQRFRVTVVARSLEITTPVSALRVGEKRTLTVSLLPEATTDKTVRWESENQTVAKVTAEGVVEGLAPGETTIKASSVSNPALVATYRLTVEAAPVVPVGNNIKINGQAAVSYETGKLKELLATHTSLQSLEWESGTMNSADAGALYESCLRIKKLNMKNLRIVADDKTYKPGYNEAQHTSADELPPYLCSKGYALEEVILPDVLKSIGKNAFQGGAKKLQSIQLPEGIEVIEEFAFQGTGITSINFPSSLKVIKQGAFSGTKLSGELSIPHVEELYLFTFHGNPFTSVRLGSKLRILKDNPFESCGNVTSFTVDAGNPNFKSQDGAVYSSDGTTLYLYPLAKVGATLEIPTQIKHVGVRVFCGCTTYTALKLHEGLESIDDSAFRNGIYTTLELPASLKKLHYRGFSNNKKLNKVTMKGTVPPVWDTPTKQFDECYISEGIYVPKTAVDAYKEATGWKEWSSRIKPVEP